MTNAPIHEGLTPEEWQYMSTPLKDMEKKDMLVAEMVWAKHKRYIEEENAAWVAAHPKEAPLPHQLPEPAAA